MKTNHLYSHVPEHTTFPADKPIPVEIMRRIGTVSARARRAMKKTHSRRSRRWRMKEWE